MKIKKIVCTIVFLFLVVVVFRRISTICRFSSWPGSERGFYVYGNLRHLASYPIDVAAFGSSVCVRSFVPAELFSCYGMSSYNIGGAWQPCMISYFMLEELLKYEQPKIVVLEVAGLFANSPPEVAYRLGFDGRPLSQKKLELIDEHCKVKKAESKISYVFPILKYHSAWKNLLECGFRKTDDVIEGDLYQGWWKQAVMYKATKNEASFKGWKDTGTKEAEFYAEGYEYVCKFIELCKEKNIDVVLYKTPLVSGWTYERHNAAQKMADSYGLAFIDFHTEEVWKKSGFDFATDMGDKGHVNTLGAIKITRYLGDFIRKNYDTSDYRRDTKYKGLVADYHKYKREIYGESFVFETNMSAYLDKLLKEKPQDYTVIFSVKDSCQAMMGEKITSQMRQLGFKSDKVFDEWRHSFIGIWQDGKVVYENRSETTNNKDTDFLKYEGVFPDGKKYSVKSAGWFCGNISSIKIGLKEWSKNSRGFNVVVYDNKTHRVVDSVCWDTHKDAGITYAKIPPSTRI